MPPSGDSVVRLAVGASWRQSWNASHARFCTGFNDSAHPDNMRTRAARVTADSPRMTPPSQTGWDGATLLEAGVASRALTFDRARHRAAERAVRHHGRVLA